MARTRGKSFAVSPSLSGVELGPDVFCRKHVAVITRCYYMLQLLQDVITCCSYYNMLLHVAIVTRCTNMFSQIHMHILKILTCDGSDYILEIGS